ncbi:hypothetical protein MMC25_007427 [Agyrium rufum]|nr:hypothetical protein [Agyrium rufum]
MPRWGRPSGGRHSDKGKRRDRQEEEMRRYEAYRRFEDLESDSGEDRGVHLDDSFDSQSYRHYGANVVHPDYRRSSDMSTSSEGSEESEAAYARRAANMQMVTIRDKEEDLVQRAYQRIQRAQMLGKKNVKLSRQEMEALERARKNEQAMKRKAIAPTASKDKRPSSRKSTSSSKAGSPAASRKASRSSMVRPESAESVNAGLNPPGFVVPGPDGRAIYSPLGYYQANAGSSRSSLRSASSQNLQQATPPILPRPQPRGSDPTRRHLVNTQPAYDGSPRPLPDDPNWIPPYRTRPQEYPTRYVGEGGQATPPYPMDPFLYQTHGPRNPGPTRQSGRRYVSGLADLQHEQQYRSIPRSLRPHVPPSSSSDPSLLHREYSGGSRGRGGASDSDYDDSDEGDEDLEDEDDEEGVLVDVVPYAQGQGYDMHVRKASPSVAGGGGVKQRKGRR